MNVRKVTLKQINISDALRYLGYGNASPDETSLGLLRKCEAELLTCLDCRYIYRVFPLADGQIPGSAFRLEGKSIEEHLKGCSQIILLCTTLSGGVDRLIRRKQLTGMAEAMMIDALASAAVEQVCDIAESEILKDFPGLAHTWRFGLGYGDFPLEGQNAFLELLDAPKRIGVCVSPALLLTPIKSVTCVIGLGGHIEAGRRKTCEMCTLRNSCAYRRIGTTCHLN